MGHDGGWIMGVPCMPCLLIKVRKSHTGQVEFGTSWRCLTNPNKMASTLIR